MTQAETVALVQSLLTDDLRRSPWKGSSNLLAGHCYVASETLCHFLGVDLWKPMFVSHEGAPHWFLKNRTSGEILDATAGQFASPVPYEKGTGKGFLTRQPSKRSQIILQKMKDRGTLS
jgi:hypothetical protein